MRKLKFILLIIGLSLNLKSYANDVSTDLMLINNYNLRTSSDMWSRIKAGFKLDHTETSRVKFFEHLYTKNPRAFERLMNRSLPYLYFLLTEIERRGLPTELVFIPGIESSYNPLVERSDDAYAGMWQFVPITGRRFNMQQNDDLDERRSIVKSSRAALNYFSYLYGIFQQWDIAIGAYNWGEGGMYRAILDSGQTVGNVRYSKLHLRQITMDYEVKLVALSNIISNPDKFGVKLDSFPNQPYFAIVNPKDKSLAQIVDISKVDTGDFHKLNGQYKDKNYALNSRNFVLLPIANQNIYYANVGAGAIAAPNAPVNEEPGILLAMNSSSGSGGITSDNDATDDAIMSAANNYKDINTPISYAPKSTRKEMDDLISTLDDKDFVVKAHKVSKDDQINQIVAASEKPNSATAQPMQH